MPTTVAQFSNDYIRNSTRLGWKEQHDLALDLSVQDGMSHLTFAQCRTLIAAACNGLPVVLTWKVRLGDNEAEQSATVIIDDLSIGHEASRRFYVRYWGFCHPVYVKDVRGITVPDTQLS